MKLLIYTSVYMCGSVLAVPSWWLVECPDVMSWILPLITGVCHDWNIGGGLWDALTCMGFLTHYIANYLLFFLIATSPDLYTFLLTFLLQCLLCKTCQSNLLFQPCFQIPNLCLPANHAMVCYCREQCTHFLKVLILVFKGVKQ